MSLLVFKQLCYMMVVVLISFAVAKKFKFGQSEINFTSKILLYLVNPCMLLNALNIPYDSQKIKSLAFMLLLSLAIHLLMMIVACLVIRSKSEEGKLLDGIDRTGVIFTNSGFIGIPLINGVLGQEGVFYLTGYLVVFNILLWIFAPKALGCSFSIKKIVLNPNVLAVVIGFILFCLPGSLPEIVAKPVLYIGQMNTALSMILLGMVFADFNRGKLEKRLLLRSAWTAAVRLILCPAAVLALVIASLFLFKNTHDIKLMAITAFIAAICPIGMSITSLAVIFKRDSSYAAFIVALTSALCIISTPLWVYLISLFL